MSDIKGDELHQYLQTMWDELADYNVDAALLQEALQQTLLLNTYSNGNHFAACLFSYFRFRLHYASTNIANYLSAPPETVLEKGIPFILDKLLPEQRKFFRKNAPWMIKKLVAYSLVKNKEKVQFNLVNWSLAQPSGANKKVLIQLMPVKWNRFGFPQAGLMLFHSVKPYITGDDWWTRLQLGDKIWNYHSSTEKYDEGDVISLREKEVLHQLHQGRSSREIAGELCISANTVDNHRRNMLKRTGANDTTALLYIGEMTGML